ncbi:hypothetical protein Bca4012_076581 [Brassica carinata]
MINEFGIRAYHIYAWIINESVQEEPPWCVTVGEIEDDGQSSCYFVRKSQYIGFLIERYIWLDQEWELANAIQQKELAFTMFMSQYKVWSFILLDDSQIWKRSNVNMQKTTNKLVTFV